MKHLCSVLFAGLTIPVLLSAQGVPSVSGSSRSLLQPRVGVYGGAALNLHHAGFSALPGTPSCCQEYRFGAGLGPIFGVLYEHPLGSELLLSIRAGYSAAGGTLLADEETTVESGGVSIPMVIEHRLEALRDNLGVSGLVGWRLNPRLRLLGGFGLDYVITADFSQQERMSDDTRRGTFENGRRTRNEFNGRIPGSSGFQASVQGGAGYDLPLNRTGTLLVSPELLLAYSLSPVSQEVDWSIHSIRFGVGVKYWPGSDPLPPPFLPGDPQTPPVPPLPELVASISVFGLDRHEHEHRAVTLEVEEFTTSDFRPLLNFVFFETDSAVLPDRYRSLSPEQALTFDPNDLHGAGPLSEHYHLLNIIGSRMRKTPESEILLVGANADAGSELGDLSLSRNRAEIVQTYLHDVWGISRQRMRIAARNLPLSPSNPVDPDGQAENRRVEIVADDPAITAPVHIADTLRRATPPTIRLRPEIESSAGIRQWEITVVQDGHILKRFSGTGDVPEVIDWRIDTEKETIPRAPGRLFYTFRVEEQTGRVAETMPEGINIEQLTIHRKQRERRADVEIERYGLILFDYDKAVLKSEHQVLLQELAERVRSDAKVLIRGFADRTGDQTQNGILAEKRARQVAEALNLPDDQVTTEASTIPPYDNTFPEGRFYSRTVIIEVYTPVRQGDAG